MTALRCREIETNDTPAIINLFAKGFNADRRREYWEYVMRTLSAHHSPPGLPRYGYLLESAGVPVGALLTIFSSVPVDDAIKFRCNLSSWYVEPEFRSYAPLLATHASRRKCVTYSNLSPAPHTWSILESQGFKTFASGLFSAVPVLADSVPGAHVQAFAADTLTDPGLPPSEVQLLLDHANYGCLSLLCEFNGQRFPFVFRPGVKYGIIRCAHLIYCRDLADLIRFAHPIGLYLGRHVIPLIDINSNGPIPGLVGRYRAERPKFCKGPDPMRLGDISYSELAMFGT